MHSLIHVQIQKPFMFSNRPWLINLQVTIIRTIWCKRLVFTMLEEKYIICHILILPIGYQKLRYVFELLTFGLLIRHYRQFPIIIENIVNPSYATANENISVNLCHCRLFYAHDRANLLMASEVPFCRLPWIVTSFNASAPQKVQ